jgi:hypothetical protein
MKTAVIKSEVADNVTVVFSMTQHEANLVLSLLDKNSILNQARKLGLGNFDNLDDKTFQANFWTTERGAWRLG